MKTKEKGAAEFLGQLAVLIYYAVVGFVSYHVIKFVWAVMDVIFPVGKS